MKKLSFLLLTLSLSVPLLAESMYIDDTLFVPLRSGPSTDFRIIHKGLKSGTRLEILEQDDESGYSKVLTSSGKEGFLPSRYLTSVPIAKIKLAEAERKLAQTLSQNDALQQELKQLNQQHQTLSANHKNTVSKLNSNSQELTNIKNISANAINLDRRNRELRESNEQLRSELELLQTENMRLKDKSESNMMLIGGGLVTLGVIIALILPMIKPSKKNDSWA